MSKNTQEWIAVAMIIILLICAFVVAGQRDNLKQEAVNRGFAEWKVVGENKTEFIWREKQ
jgi:hypothetical protein